MALWWGEQQQGPPAQKAPGVNTDRRYLIKSDTA